MEQLTRTLLLASSACAVVLIWLESSLTADWRAWCEARGGWIKELAGCPLCLCVQTCLWLGLVALAAGVFSPLLPDAVLFVGGAPVPALLLLRLTRKTLIDDSQDD